ncbi:LysR family transcriptional regulator [Nitratireductor sp. ZSWI3]|uniref:LysR family transcriptional regulator n=1 Tax=Nitratireductor sp. ZSWI3 TaxID=2966359 RepID=UPI002150248C|nr:LysR family transcriptional regulator [Nitratireductor sp. ZSWI3]MCR4266997.1 LysR family transcriptional regulator [Nitratireductor sp. ZSWI3]
MPDAPMTIGSDALIRKGLKLSHLRLIASLKETGRMSAAAAQLAISQPAASRLVGEMERIVGVPLHGRHARGIVLTPYGERLALRARAILQGLGDAARELSEMERGSEGTVSIGAVTAPALDVVLPALRQARLTHPKISIEVTVDTSDRLAEDLLAARSDFFIGRILGDLDPKMFVSVEIAPEPIALIVRSDHPLTRRRQISLEECVAYDWVVQPRGGLLRRTAENHLMARGVPLPDKTISTSSLLLTLAYISQSNAIAPVSRAVADFYAHEEGLSGRIVALPVSADFAVAPYSLIRHAERPLSPSSQVLFNMIGETARLRAASDAPMPAAGR